MPCAQQGKRGTGVRLKKVQNSMGLMKQGSRYDSYKIDGGYKLCPSSYPLAFQCVKCQRTFNTFEHRLLHFALVQPYADLDGVPFQDYYCPGCANKITNKESEVQICTENG